MRRWALQPLLGLRRLEAERATGALARALARHREAEAEVAALRGRGAEAAGRALAPWPVAWPDPSGGAGDRPGGAAPPELAVLAGAARCAARRRQEVVRIERLSVEAETRARAQAATVEARQAALRRAALGREVVERLEAAWRRSRAAEAARRAEAALDERPWPARPATAAPPGGGRPAPARTGW